MTATAAAVWVIILMVPGPDPLAKKLVVHKFASEAVCEANIPKIKRYYRLYGDRWTGRCSRSIQRAPLFNLF